MSLSQWDLKFPPQLPHSFSAIFLIGSFEKRTFQSADLLSILLLAFNLGHQRDARVGPLSTLVSFTHPPSLCFHLIEYSNLDWGHSYRLDSSRLRQVSKAVF
jgi:hypothetical protein